MLLLLLLLGLDPRACARTHEPQSKTDQEGFKGLSHGVQRGLVPRMAEHLLAKLQQLAQQV